jgi:hypothetical protein
MVINHRIRSLAPELSSDLLVLWPGLGLKDGFLTLVVSSCPITDLSSDTYNYLPGRIETGQVVLRK